MDFPSHMSLQLGEGALCTGAKGCRPCHPCSSPQGSPTKLGSPEGVGEGTCSPALSLSPFSFLEAPLAWRAPCGLPWGLTLNHLGPGHTRGPEAAGPSGLCAEPRPGHLGWPEAEAVVPSAPRPSQPDGWRGGGGPRGARLPREGRRSCPGSALFPEGPSEPLISYLHRRGGGVAAALDSTSYSPNQS